MTATFGTTDNVEFVMKECKKIEASQHPQQGSNLAEVIESSYQSGKTNLSKSPFELHFDVISKKADNSGNERRNPIFSESIFFHFDVKSV
jgi:hypothetical protein